MDIVCVSTIYKMFLFIHVASTLSWNLKLIIINMHGQQHIKAIQVR